MSIGIAIDFSTLDTEAVHNGMFRYVVDLLQGLEMAASHDFRFIVLGSKAQPVEEIRHLFVGAPHRWTYERVVRGSHRGSYWTSHLSYWPILRRHRAQVFHGPHGFIPALAPCRVVCTIADLMQEMFEEYRHVVEGRAYQVNRWLATHRATRLIAISETTARDVQNRWHVPAANIDVVPLGLSAAFSTDTVDGRPVGQTARSDAATVLAPFNLEPRKNLHTLLEAVAILQRTLPVRLVLYGRAGWTQDREERFSAAVRSLRLERAVDRLGVIDDQHLAHRYRQCDLFVFPSLYEGFGYPVLEAMAAGACVVARNASAMAEILGGAGALVETQDPQALADTMASLLSDPERRTRLSLSARRRAASYSTARLAEGTLRSYLAALGRPRSVDVTAQRAPELPV